MQQFFGPELAKERLDDVDEAIKPLSDTVVDGDSRHTNFTAQLRFQSAGDDGFAILDSIMCLPPMSDSHLALSSLLFCSRVVNDNSRVVCIEYCICYVK